MIIYKAENTINEKVYIGQTVGSLGKRMIEHKYQSKNGDSYFQRSIRKHGWDAFKWSVLEQCETEDELNDLEYHYIQQYKRFMNGVYNCTIGGDGTSGHKHSEETKKRIGDGNRGKTHTDETRQIISEKKKGHIVTDETRQKIREARTGWVPTEEQKKNIANAQCKHTYKVERPDEGIDIVTNLSEYCRLHGLNQGSMSLVVNGKRNHHQGFRAEKIENIPLPAPTYDRTTPLMEVFFGVPDIHIILGRKSLGA